VEIPIPVEEEKFPTAVPFFSNHFDSILVKVEEFGKKSSSTRRHIGVHAPIFCYRSAGFGPFF
jgi:hypothetical protein